MAIARPKRRGGRPSKLTDAQWAEARGLFEAGKTTRAIAAEFGIAQGTLTDRIEKDGWQVNAEAAIRQRTAEKLAGVSGQADPQKKEEAIDAEAERRVAILQRHAEEWEMVAELQARAIRFNRDAVEAAEEVKEEEGKPAKFHVVKGVAVDKARAAEAFELSKFAKINAETTAIRHAGERKAIGMDAPEEDPRAVRVIVERKGATAG